MGVTFWGVTSLRLTCPHTVLARPFRFPLTAVLTRLSPCSRSHPSWQGRRRGHGRVHHPDNGRHDLHGLALGEDLRDASPHRRAIGRLGENSRDRGWCWQRPTTRIRFVFSLAVVHVTPATAAPDHASSALVRAVARVRRSDRHSHPPPFSPPVCSASSRQGKCSDKCPSNFRGHLIVDYSCKAVGNRAGCVGTGDYAMCRYCTTGRASCTVPSRASRAVHTSRRVRLPMLSLEAA